MGPESKGRAWFGKIYNKLETILVEVDTFTAQSTLCMNSTDPSGWGSVRGVTDEVAEDRSSDLQQHQYRFALPSCGSPSDPPSQQNFDVLGNVRIEEQVEEDILEENFSASSSSDGETLSGAPLLHEYCDGNLTSATTLGDEEESKITNEESQITETLTPQKFSAEEVLVFPSEESVEEVRVESFRDLVPTESQSTQSSVGSFGIVVACNDDPVLSATLGISTEDSNQNPTDKKIPDAPVQENVASITASNEDNPDDVINGKSDVAPLHTIALSGMEIREDASYVDDNALYAVRARTKKLRSFKRKILDALTAKKRREKEYEQLAIWFGDADMGSDLVREDSEHKEAIDSKSSQVHESEDSQWELL